MSIFPLTFRNYSNEIIYQQATDLKELFCQGTKNPLQLMFIVKITANTTTTVFLKHYLLFGKYLIKRKQTFPWR